MAQCSHSTAFWWIVTLLKAHAGCKPGGLWGLRHRSLFIGGGGGLAEKFQKNPFFIKTPLDKAIKNFRTPPPPLFYNIQFNIITKFSILLNKHISLCPCHSSTLRVVVINWGCSSPSNVSSELPNSSIISSSESSLVVSVSLSHIDRAVTKDCNCPVFGRHV